jgi:hypothetical protein
MTSSGGVDVQLLKQSGILFLAAARDVAISPSGWAPLWAALCYDVSTGDHCFCCEHTGANPNGPAVGMPNSEDLRSGLSTLRNTRGRRRYRLNACSLSRRLQTQELVN